jgi:hypothetical protein
MPQPVSSTVTTTFSSRCSAASVAPASGTDAVAAEAFARHQQLSTTTRYDRRREEAKREGARRLAELKRVPPAPVRPRPRGAPRGVKKGRGGFPRWRRWRRGRARSSSNSPGLTASMSENGDARRAGQTDSGGGRGDG